MDDLPSAQALAALVAIGALYVELVEAGVLAPAPTAQAISAASVAIAQPDNPLSEIAVPFLDVLALRVLDTRRR